MSLYRPSLELPEVRHFRPNFVDSGDGTKKLDPMLACRVVVIKWVAQFTHLTRNATSGTNVTEMEQVISISREKNLLLFFREIVTYVKLFANYFTLHSFTM